MPANGKFDFLLNHQGYILSRPQNGLARAWARTGVPDTPSIEQPRLSQEFGGLPPQIEYPEVWVDWSGGFGFAYRHPKDENSYFGFLANPNTYHWSENFDARFSRQLVHAQALGFVSINISDHFIAVEHFLDTPIPGYGPCNQGEGAVLALRNVSGVGLADFIVPTGTASQPYKLSSEISESVAIGFRPALYGSYCYIPNQVFFNSFGFWQLRLADAAVTIANTGAENFVVAGNSLWLSQSSTVRHVAAPDANLVLSESNWTFSLSVGDGYGRVKDLVELADQVYVGKTNGLYAGDSSGTFVNVLTQLKNQIHADNCRDLAVFGNEVLATHIGGLYAYKPAVDAATAQEIGPQSHSNRSPVHGYPRCVTALGQWVYAGYYTGSTSYILAGFDDRPGSGTFVWHPLQRLPHTARVHRIHFDGITSSSGNANKLPNRLWIATDASIDIGGTCPTYVSPIPLLNDNPIVPSIAFVPHFTNSARMDLGNTDGRAPTTPKLYRSCEVWADNLDGSQRWGLIYYTVDQGQRVLLGTANTSPKSVLYFPQGDPAAGGSFVMGQSIELSLESYIAAGAEATSPVYRSIVLRQAYTPRSVDVITAVVDVGDGMVDRQGSPMRPGLNQLQELHGLIATGPVQLVDLVGATWWAKVLAPVEEQEQWQEGGGNPSVLATIKMAILSFSGP